MANESPHTIIIGGGVIGLCSAWYLGKAGHRVTVLDRDPSKRECCSEQNAGLVVPSHFVPLAAPGMIGLGLKWMFNPRSPFSIRPTLDPKQWTWCWKFARFSNQDHVRNCEALLRDLSLESRKLFVELSGELDFPLVQRGLLVLCQSEEALAEEAALVERAHHIGIEAELCDSARIRELDPDVETKAIGGVWFAQDCHLDPQAFLGQLRNGIAQRGGTFVAGEAADFSRESNRITGIVTEAGDSLSADSIVLASGAWSPRLARKLRLTIPIEAGKGHSLTLAEPRKLPRLCSLLKEARVAVTPMGNKLRLAGTMEIGGDDLSVNHTRVEGIVASFCRYFPEFDPGDFSGIEPWAGLRPCTPDGLPCLGKVPGLENAVVATGHAMLGLSLGPISGALVAELLSETPPRMDLARLAPDRFS